MKDRFKMQICILIVVLASGLSYAQVQNFAENISKRGTTAASFLEVGVGGRALAMGGAYTAAANDPSAIYWNVAGIAKMQKSGIFFNHSEWIADTNFDFISGVFQMGRYGALGVSLTALTMDEMAVTTVDDPEGLLGQRFNAGDFSFSVAYAIRLTENFSIGFNPKVIHQYIWQLSATGFAMDLGVHYNTPFKGVQLGFALTNFGSKMQMSGENARVLYDFEPGSSGNNERVPAILETNSWALPLNFKIGMLYKLLNVQSNSVNLAVDAQYPNNDYESLNVGIEYNYGNRLSLRGGYRGILLDDTEESFTFGAGLNFPVVGNVMLHFDFAYADFGLLEEVQKYSLAIDF
ncbi:MAG: PorV/PorQ family protein [Calditrichia bacterium]